MDKDKKILKKNKVVEYNPDEETVTGMHAELNKYIFPMITINEESNVNRIGYIDEMERLFIQYKCMTKSIEGFELGVRPEPFGYFYHNVHKSLYNDLIKSKNKAKFINEYIKKNYMFHRERILEDF